MNLPPKTANATFCATLCDQLWVDGLRAAFVAPGSRSTPLALALVAHPAIAVEVFHDERSAAFAALGHALATGIPGLVLCSSGTAGAHFYAAVIEADASAVPMIVCTADRPPELWGRGAPQTIDQTNLYGDKVRLFAEPGPPDDLEVSRWRWLARDLWQAATGSRPGPVHANLSFREPLTGLASELPSAIAPLAAAMTPVVDPAVIEHVGTRLIHKRGVLIVGRHQSDPEHIAELADTLGWPIICDHRSGCRASPHALRHFDALLREPTFTDRHVPEVVLRIGEIVSSKSTSQWLAQCGSDVLASRPHGRNIDPENIARLQFDEQGAVAALLTHLASRGGEDASCDPSWNRSWQAADRITAGVVDTTITADHRSEIAVARDVLNQLPTRAALVVSSSMPVRDIEWFGAGDTEVQVIANRGANGIDGIIATATGVALSGVPTVCLIGDVAFLHDSSSLTALREREVDLTIVVIDNDGGGIFSFLPQHELLEPAVYEKLFGTPHGTDIEALAAAHGLRVTQWTRTDSPLVNPGTGPRVVVALTARRTCTSTTASLNRSGQLCRMLLRSCSRRAATNSARCPTVSA